MAVYYPTTAVPFGSMQLPDLRDPVLAGMSTVEAAGSAADQYRTLADALEKASEDLRAVMNTSQGAHEGEAAAASRHYVMRLAAVGDLGAAQSRISMDALFDGLSYYTRARDDMQALADTSHLVDPKTNGPVVTSAQQLEEMRLLAVEAARRYESNANWALQRSFQSYEPEPIAPPGAIGGGPGGGAGLGGVGGSGVTGPGGGASAAGAETGVAASESVGPGAGAGSVGIGAGAGATGGIGAQGIPPAGPAGGAGAGAAGAAGGGAPGLVGPGGVGSSAAGPGRSGSGGTGRGGAGAGGIGSGGGRGGAVGGTGGSGPGPAALRPASEDPDVGRHGGRAAGAGQGRYPGLDRAAGARPSSGWVPGTPWSSRPGADGSGAWGSGGGAGGGVGGGYAGRPGEEPHGGQGHRGGTPTAGPGATGGSPPGRGPAGAHGYGGTPMMGAGGAGQQGETHTRPSWLLEDDPEAFWFRGMPEYGPAVIGGDDDRPGY